MSPEVQSDFSLTSKVYERTSSQYYSRIVVIIIINYTINIKTYLVPNSCLDPSSLGTSRNSTAGPVRLLIGLVGPDVYLLTTLQ